MPMLAGHNRKTTARKNLRNGRSPKAHLDTVRGLVARVDLLGAFRPGLIFSAAGAFRKGQVARRGQGQPFFSASFGRVRSGPMTVEKCLLMAYKIDVYVDCKALEAGR